jgi:hypothetical protein
MVGRRLRASRFGLAMCMALILGAATAGSSMAASPDRAPAPSPDGIVDETCGFAIGVTFPVNDQFAITFFDRHGDPTRVLILGNLVATLTNLSTGESITVNISGPGRMTLPSGEITTMGRWSAWPEGHLVIQAGRTEPDGSFHGRTLIDVCEVLAPAS